MTKNGDLNVKKKIKKKKTSRGLIFFKTKLREMRIDDYPSP